MTNPDDVVDCGVGEPFLDQLVRYHCPIYCIIHFDRPVASTYKRKVWKFSKGDYPNLRRIVSTFDWNSCSHIDIDIYAANLTKPLMSFCDTCFPSKVVTIRKQDPPWFHNEIRLSLRQRRRAYNSAKRSNSIYLWTKLTFLSEKQNKTTLINLPQNLRPPITALTSGKQ